MHLYDAKLPRTATRKVKRAEVAEIVTRLVAATAPSPLDGATNPVRVAISVVRHRTVESIAAGATLQGDLSFDSLALSELLGALEARCGSIDSDALQRCRTVAEVEALVGIMREPAAQADGASPRARIEAGRDEGEPIVLPAQLQEAGKRFIGALQDVFYGQLMSARVYGRAYIPQNRNTIVVANHASHLDMGFVRHALGTYGEDIVSLAAQDYFFDKSLLRRAFFENLTNLQALDRTKGLRASERQAAEILRQGKTMLIFPEGTRSPDGDVHEFKPLLGHLALANAVDILPVYLGGTRDAMPKGSRLPSRRDLTARIGLPLTVSEMRRLTQGMTPADASREASRLAREAILALRAGEVLDLARLGHSKGAPKDTGALARAATPEPEVKKREHPLVTLFTELGTKFKPGSTAKPISFYFTLGGDPLAKWTVRVDAASCDIRPGKPEGDAADCVLKTTPEIFERIVREAYVPERRGVLSSRRREVERHRAPPDLPEGLRAGLREARSMARYFVTGATGFLGGHLALQLRARGDAVVALCRDDEPDLEDRGVELCSRQPLLDRERGPRAGHGRSRWRVSLRRQGLAAGGGCGPALPDAREGDRGGHHGRRRCTCTARGDRVDERDRGGERRSRARRDRGRPFARRADLSLALLPHQALRRRERARGQPGGLCGRIGQPDVAPRPVARTLAARRPRTCGCSSTAASPPFRRAGCPTWTSATRPPA